jgi:hypothetical protein
VRSAIDRPATARLIASGGDDDFGSIVYDEKDPDSGVWSRSCLVYFADSGQVRQVYVQSSEPEQALT